MPDNDGLVTRFSNLAPAKPIPAAQKPHLEVVHSKARASQLPLDTTLMDEARRDAKSMRIIGYALLAVTGVLAVVVLWPWLSV